MAAFAAALARGYGAPWARLVLVAMVVLAGQLSIGFANDWLDAGRDRAAGRVDKPVATGLVGAATVRTLAWSSLAVAAAGSVVISPAFAAAHLGGVACGWAYDLGLKRTMWSGVAYAGGFALVPVFAALAGEPPVLPGPAIVVAAACLGVAAHLVQTLGDHAADAATGVHGLPQRLGARGSAIGAGVSIAAGSLCALAAGRGGGSPGLGVLVAAGVGAAVGVAVAGWRGRARTAFALAVVAAALLVAAVLVGAVEPAAGASRTA